MPEAVTLDERYVRLAGDLADRAGEECPNRRARPGPPAERVQYARHFGSGGGQCGARVDLGDLQIDRVREQPRTQTGPPPRTSTEPAAWIRGEPDPTDEQTDEALIIGRDRSVGLSRTAGTVMAAICLLGAATIVLDGLDLLVF